MERDESDCSDFVLVESDSEDSEMIQESRDEEAAESKREEGNELYKRAKYREALECYTQAINMCPLCAEYYGNRAAAYMMIKKYKEGLHDAQKAVQLNPTFVKGYVREGKCHLMLGNSMAASNCFKRVLEIDSNNETASTELKNLNGLQEMEAKVDLNFVRGDHRTALYCLNKCLERCPASQLFRVRKAEALALLGRQQEAQELANDVLVRDEINPDALYVRGLSAFYQDHTERAIKHFHRVLRLAPDHTKARETLKRVKQLIEQKEAGNCAFRENRLQEAYDFYTKALEIDTKNHGTNSKLYSNRATVSMKFNKLRNAITDCTHAIELDARYLKAYLKRAKCYMDLKQYQDAVKDYEKIYKLQKSRENKQLLREAKSALKRSIRKNYYTILDVEKTATVDQIKKAYKKQAMTHHPDRHANASKEDQKKEEIKFKEVAEAYAVLSDNMKRAQHDASLEMEDLTSGCGDVIDVDADEIFRAFFNNTGSANAAAYTGAPAAFSGSNFTFPFQ